MDAGKHAPLRGVHMTILLYLTAYAAFLTFAVAAIARAIRYAKAPLHLRWEVYPVPHEAPQRMAHGGSYFESSEWWMEKRRCNLAGELAAMLPEMIFLKGLWEFNRRLWRVSFLFHFGLYLLIATIAMVLAAAELSILSPANATMTGLSIAYRITGIGGVCLALVGAAGLLLRRLRDKELQNYTAPADIFNLAFFLVTLIVLLVGYVTRPAGVSVWEIARGMLTFNTAIAVPRLFAIGLLLACVLVAYVPLTHMSHFIAKYFTYHAVRWDDHPNLRGGRMEAKLAEYLTYRPTWSAAHVGADGHRSWAQIAMTNPNDTSPMKAAATPEVSK
jgi:nitrate reductase gamma subunit